MHLPPAERSAPIPLEAIVYASAARTELAEDRLEALLRTARDFNHAHAITGVLLYHDGSFLQYFEGRPADVARVYRRVRESTLHHSMIELVRTPIARRLFPEWVMGFARPPTSLMLRLSNASWKAALSASAAASPDSEGLYLLRQFWQLSRPFGAGPAIAAASGTGGQAPSAW